MIVLFFSEVPTKAIIKYANAFNKRMSEKYNAFKSEVMSGESKINTSGLFCYEIVNKFINGFKCDEELYDLMWKNQKNVFDGCKNNVLVVADTSGSMTCCNGIPLSNSIGLALYTAERNSGVFKNHFITFSSEPYLCEVKGNTIKEKIRNVPCIVANTNIDKVFKLILDTAVSNHISEEELPSHLIIISDMEFDEGVYSQGGTNFEGWKKAFSESGYKLPTIVFWNVAGSTNGVPVTNLIVMSLW